MKGRPQKIAWLVVIALIALQTYVVRELLAVLAMVSLVFAGFAILITALKSMQWAFERLSLRAEVFAHREFSGRPFRRLRSLTAR